MTDTAAPPLVRMCKLGLHVLPKSSGQCIECRRERNRQSKRAKAAQLRAARGLEPLRMCARGLHRMVGANIAAERRLRLDGTPYEIERCYACSTKRARRRNPGDEKEVSVSMRRLAAARRIAEIEAEILAMCDVLEISSRFEVEQMRIKRAELTQERDRLERGR